MKDLIGAVIFVVGLYGGTIALRVFHGSIRKAAFEKAAAGLPALTEVNRSLRRNE